MRLKGSKDVNVVKARIRLMDGGGINLKLLALIILTSFGAAGAIGATIACYPSRPEYCTRCHSMRPAHDRWASTVCRDVNCVECHTGGRGVVCLSREIEDSNCTNGGCHTQEKLFAKKEPYKKTLPFSHETHLKEDPPGLKMRCTACHSYQGGMKHFDIDEKTCNLCHFILRKEVTRLVVNEMNPLADGGRQEPNRCTLCHKDVEKKIQIYDKEFDHAAYERLALSKAEGKAGVECMDCHYNETIHGLGDVERRQCYHCHDKVPKDYSSAKEMHYDHMVRHKVGCNPCHQEIIHKIYREDKELEGCESCRGVLRYAPTLPAGQAHLASGGTTDTNHSLVGSVQRQMTRGEGGRGVNGTPDPMFLATVSCTGCHKSSLDKRGDTDMPALNRPFAPLQGRSGSGPTPGPYEGVDPMVCNNCHEKDFEKIYKEHKDMVTSQMEVLEKLLRVAGETGRAEAVETMEARHNYEFIASEGSVGVHNIKYTKELLELSIRQLGESMGS